MRSIVLSLFVFIAVLWGIQAQNVCEYSVEGRIFDLKTGEPLPFASVKVEGTDRGTVADENGFFKIEKLCIKEFNLIFSFIGYKSTTHHHDSYHKIPSIYLAPDNVYLKSVVIEGHRDPVSIASISRGKIDQETLRKKSMASLGEIVSNLSGVSMLQTGQNISKPIIHGMHSNRVLIINNGIRHEFQNWGDEHAPEIDASMANEIEVVKGASTVRYGPDALGGVLLIDPKPLPLNTGIEGEFGITGQTNGLGGNMKGVITYGLEHWSFHAEGKYLKLGDLNAPDYMLTNTGREESTLAAGLRYHKSSIDLEAHYSRVNQDLGILRGSVTGNLSDLSRAMSGEEPLYTDDFSYIIDNPRQDITHDMVKMKGSYLTGQQVINVQYGFQKNIRREFDVRRGTNNVRPSIDLELSTHSLDVDWDHPAIGALNGLVGLQWQYQDNNNLPGTNTVPFIPNYNNTRFGVFLNESLEAGNNTWEAGIRYDYQYTSARGREPNNDIYRNTIDFHNLTATAGFIKELDADKTFRSNIGTAWRPPNVSELFSYGKRLYSVEYGLWRYTLDENNEINVGEVLSNDQKKVSSEIGYKWINNLSIKNKALQADFTGYVNLIRNFIYKRPAGITNTVRGAFPYFIYDQDDAFFWGLDTDIRMTHSSSLESTFSASYVWARDISNDDLFIGIPPATVHYELSYLPKSKFLGAEADFSASGNYTFRQFQAPRTLPVEDLVSAAGSEIGIFEQDNSNFDLLDAPSGFLLIGLDMTLNWQKSSVILQSNNLLNEEYRIYTDLLRYFADQPGLNFQVTYIYRL